MWDLKEDGDGLEQCWCDYIRGKFPRYEEFWRSYIVPQTFRILRKDVIILRPGSPALLRALANASYGVCQHLVEARSALDNEDLTHNHTVYQFFQRLYSVSENVDRFLAATRKVVGAYGGPQVKDNAKRFQLHKKSKLWTDYVDVVGRIKKYRGPYAHENEIVRIGDLLPTSEVLEKYSDLATLAPLLARIIRET